MDYFTAQTFDIPELTGISAQNIEEHMKLYTGYVKNANYIQKQLRELPLESYERSELQRRFAFEYGGMRNHEIFFSHLEGGAQELEDGELKAALEKEWGSFENFMNHFKRVASTRGIGWTMLYKDTSGHLLTQWVDEQHLGHLQGLTPLLALDMWEHAFVADYQPSGKGTYIEDFFKNLNWSSVEKRYK